VLIIERRLSEKLLIGKEIIVTVCRIKNDKVRLGIEAPANVEIDRSEVRERKERGK